MATLLSCQPPPPPGYVTVLEQDCQFISCPAEEREREGGEGEGGGRRTMTSRGVPPHVMATSSSQKTFYTDIEVSCDRESTFLSTADLQGKVFLPVTRENPWKRVWNTWRDEGTIPALKELVHPQEGDSIGGLPAQMATYILTCIEKLQSLKGTFAPRSQMSSADLATTYTLHGDWAQSPIRAIALHLRLPFIAIGRQDDLLEIKPLNQSEHSIFLKDKNQIGIVCLEWAPHCNNLLAVGTSTGVLLWNIDPTAPTTRFLTSWVRVETSPGHVPVTSISWSPHGNFLVSASPADSCLITWDIPMGVATRVKRAKGGGLNQVLWSPDSQKVFASSVESVFRVWETENWTCEKWTNFCGRCKAACWSPKGDVLVFALEDDPSLYYLSFRGYELAAGSTCAIKCADLAPCNITSANGEEFIVGGNVQSLAWDPTGERLAVIFTSESPSANLVAILRTRTSHMLEIIHGGFIRGRDGELPSLVAFKTNYCGGALLATVWSGSRISFTPLSFQPSSSLSSFSYLEQLVSADSANLHQQQPYISGPAFQSGRGTPADSTPLQSLGRARLREKSVATPLYSTQNWD